MMAFAMAVRIMTGDTKRMKELTVNPSPGADMKPAAMTMMLMVMKVYPLARVAPRVATVGATGMCFLVAEYRAIQTSAPSGSEIRFAGGKMEWLIKAEMMPATIPIPMVSLTFGRIRMIARQ